jgi:hypothetical protein
MAQYLYGNAELYSHLGDEMGQPLTDEMVVCTTPEGNITAQVTEHGVAFYFPQLPGIGWAGSRFIPTRDVYSPKA